MGLAKTVQLRVEAAGDQAEGHVARFEGWKGSQFLRRVLVDAGLTQGVFVYHMREWFKSSGFTKPVQPRKFDSSGVHLWLKPGGNGSAVKGVLVPDKEFYTPEEVYQKLKAYVTGHPREPDAPPELDDPTTELLLLAVNEAHGTYHKTQDEFATAVIAALRACSYEADRETLDRMTEAAKARGFVTYTDKTVVVTTEGQAWLDDPARKAGDKPTPLPKPPADTLDLLKTHRAKLERLMALPDLITQSQWRQQELRTQIAALTAQLDAEVGVELDLRAEIDETAVRNLLGGGT